MDSLQPHLSILFDLDTQTELYSKEILQIYSFLLKCIVWYDAEECVWAWQFQAENRLWAQVKGTDYNVYNLGHNFRFFTYQGVSKEPTDIEIHSFSFPLLCIDQLKHSDAEAR